MKKEVKQKKEQSPVFGPMAMIKIDGAKIRLLREREGLTQLYVATAVGVTTDTISRWENGRYPNIKRDNGVRLAKALEVEIEEIMLAEEKEEDEQADDDIESPQRIGDTGKSNTPQVEPLHDTGQKHKSVSYLHRLPKFLQKYIIRFNYNDLRKKMLIIAAVVCLLFLCIVFFIFGKETSAIITAVRIAPSTALPNQRIPVIIKVDILQESETAAVILREKVVQKRQSGFDSKNIFPSPAQVPTAAIPEIKWLVQLEKSKYFTYILKTANRKGEKSLFDGTISSQGETDQEIEGSRRLVTGQYHWADENRDGVIDDREIILVYDRFSKVQGFAQEIDDVERIWLGSGYHWDEQREKLMIMPLHGTGKKEKGGDYE